MDQAKKLREIMDGLNKKHENSAQEVTETYENINKGKVISVSSGKGGVGKTNFALNLSIALKKSGYKVIVLDADIGLGNIEILSGISVSGSILDIIEKNKTIEEIISTGPGGIHIISGGSGLKELTLTNKYNLSIILQELVKLQEKYDYIVIDTGAGISDAVLDFALAADETLVVGTPDPTAIMDAYVLIKSLKIKGYEGRIKLVVNMVKNSKEGLDTYSRINGVVSEFLKMDIDYLGSINKDELVTKSIRMQTPFLIGYPNKKVSLQVIDIMNNLIKDRDEDIQGEGFAKKLMKFFMS